MARSRARIALAALVVAALGTTGCMHKKRQPAFEYMPDMAYQDREDAQAEDPLRPGYSVMREPVEGTVPRGYTPYRFAQADTVEAMAALSNPLPATAEVLGRGQREYMNTCVVCHGEKGDGQGYIVPIFPQPPSLLSEKVRTWPDARIFHIITRGQNLMPSYASQILPEDRWAVIHYVRALERAAHPTAEDLAAAGSAPAPGTAPAPALDAGAAPDSAAVGATR